MGNTSSSPQALGQLSSAQVSNFFSSLGTKYKDYATRLVESGVDGQFLVSFQSEEKLEETFEELEIASSQDPQARHEQQVRGCQGASYQRHERQCSYCCHQCGSPGGNAVGEVMSSKNIWARKILPFVGPGRFLFVATVCKSFKECCRAYSDAIKEPQMVWEDYEDEDNENKTQTIATSTFYSVAFSSVPCAKYWDVTTEAEDDHLRAAMVCETVAKCGNLHVLKWARIQGFPWNEGTCAGAACGGHLKVLRHLHTHGCPWSEDTYSTAAENGHLEVLKYAHGKGFPWDVDTCSGAAAIGKLEVLKYAHDHGCRRDLNTCSGAAEKGHLDVLRYAQ